MRKYLSLLFKGLAILSLVLSVVIIGTIFFAEEPTNAEIIKNCETNLCVSKKSKGTEVFKSCVNRCYGNSQMARGGMWVAPVFGMIIFAGLGLVFFVISALFRKKDHTTS
jgi:hypothetical protein